MQYSNYSQIAHAIANRQDFTGNSARGMNINDGGIYNYIVKSYDTAILGIKDNSITLDNQYYSPTTSKLQNIIIDALGLDIPRKRTDGSITIDISKLYMGL